MKELYIIVGPNFEPEIPKERHVSGTRQPRSDRTNEDSGWPGRVGPPPGAQRAGDIQHTPRAARQRVRQRLHILSGIRRRDACESANKTLWHFIVPTLSSFHFVNTFLLPTVPFSAWKLSSWIINVLNVLGRVFRRNERMILLVSL